MAWIRSEEGYINLATASHVAGIGGDRFAVDQFGERHTLEVMADRLEELLAPVVPGSGVLHRIHYEPASEPETFVETYPIVAWRVTCDAALPVAPGVDLTELSTMSSDSMTVIEMPDKSFAEVPGENRYESLALAREALVARGLKARREC
jgi:hypothetical protein